MKFGAYVTYLFSVIIFAYISYKIYDFFLKTQPKQLYLTEAPKKRTINQTVYATGILEIKDHIKIGSLVSGTVKEIYVKENDVVKKGQLLALIDNGKEDTQVKKSLGELEKAKAELTYQTHYLTRQKKLFNANQISKDFFEQVKRDYEQAKADIKIKKANLLLDEIEYENTKIRAATNGIIISVGVTIGQRITTDLDATVLFIIAKDIKKMEAQLDIDESDIGQTNVGQKVTFSVGTYLDKTFHGTIRKISYAAQCKSNILSYNAYMDVNNKDLLLRPGMTISAKIKIAKSVNTLSISSQAFQLNPKLIKGIAKHLQYQHNAIPKQQKKIIEKKCNKPYHIKYVWVVENNCFQEKAIKTHVTDENYFEIKSGITEYDNIIIDIEEEDAMETIYKKQFKGTL
jgi:HlyD family secretion protein